MTQRYAVLCDEVLFSRMSKITAVGLFDVIMAAEVPCVHPHACCLISLDASIDDIGRGNLVRLEFVDPEGLAFWANEVDFTTEATGQIPLIVDLVGVTFSSFGPHVLRVFLNGKLTTEWSVNLARLGGG